MRRFELVGGFFDGAHGDFPSPDDVPVVWAAPDPTSPGPFKGALHLRQRPGAFPYSLVKVENDTLTFVYSHLTDDGYKELVEENRLAA